MSSRLPDEGASDHSHLVGNRWMIDFCSYAYVYFTRQQRGSWMLIDWRVIFWREETLSGNHDTILQYLARLIFPVRHK